jgi:hypothetical protein
MGNERAEGSDNDDDGDDKRRLGYLSGWWVGDEKKEKA